MRNLLIALLSAVVAMAGCAGPDPEAEFLPPTGPALLYFYTDN